MDLCEFETSMVYRASSSLATATQKPKRYKKLALQVIGILSLFCFL